LNTSAGSNTSTGAPSRVTHSAFAVRPRLLWTSAIVLFTVAAAWCAEAKGHAARTTFSPPPEFGTVRWATVGDAGDAVRVWGEAGLHGRKVILLTGRWAQVKSMNREAVEAAAASGSSLDLLDADTAVLAAARSAIARELSVVMPPEAFQRRIDEVGGAKELSRGDGWFTLPFHGFARRFSVPGSVETPGEPVLALVEPSFFADGAPASPERWLRERGVEVELGLVALADPAATPEQRERAALFAQAAGAVSVEVAR
jgi:hypothetical protein